MAETNIQQLALQVFEAKQKWLDKCFREILPPQMYGLIHSNPAKIKVALEQLGVVIKNFPDHRSELWVGKQKISEFKLEIKDGKKPLSNN